MGLQAHRALSEELREVDLRLREWADWSKKGRLNIGWPRESISAKMAEWHRIGIRPEGGTPPAIDIPEQIARIDSLVAKLTAAQRKVVVIHYTLDYPREVKVSMSKLKGDQYRRNLDYARWSVRLGLLA